MATAVILPRLGNSVESSIIIRWMKNPGDQVETGEPICEVETDKTTVEVTSPASGVVLERFFEVGADVPVLTTIAAIGVAGENVGELRPGVAPEAGAVQSVEGVVRVATVPAAVVAAGSSVSPRARKLAEHQGVDLTNLAGSGPGGRVIERDVRAAIEEARPRMTPLARSMVGSGEFVAPEIGSGVDRRIIARDLHSVAPVAPAPIEDPQVIPLAGVRKLIAERMLASVQTTAQLTLNSSADARRLKEYRARLKASPDSSGLRGVTINDLVLFAVARTLPEYPELNAIFGDKAITRYRRVHLGMAVDTPRGLVVPVVRNADRLSLLQLSQEAARLAGLSQAGRVAPDDLTGGTFSVTNLGNLGIESFTPILNPPQVAILGVGAIQLKPVEADGAVAFVPHLSLSLTINHQVVDGAPAARFLQALARNIADLDLLVAR